MKMEEFDYHLPKSLIAQRPSSERGESRLMVVHQEAGAIEHRSFQEIIHYLDPGDLLTANNTRVLPARLVGRKDTGGRCEVLLFPKHNGSAGQWDALIKGIGRVGKQRTPLRIHFDQGIEAEVEEVKDGKAVIRFLGRFSRKDGVRDVLRRVGHIPLPPYIKREDEPADRIRYQTVFAEREGSIAAPTAGLHFTEAMLRSLQNRGVTFGSITLHVGPGTFRPVRTDPVESHWMQPEWTEISEEISRQIEETKQRGRRVIAVGTTTTRALESFSLPNGGVRADRDFSSLFIFPPYRFRVVNGLLTNFHLPRSTLILLVSAFAGKDLLMEAYRKAVEKRYRFYSYGDAMLIL